jgi:hypothetical protein
LIDSLLDRLDRSGRRHPTLMLAVTVAAVIVTTLVLIYKLDDTAIVYKAF